MAVFASEYGYYKLSNGIVIRLGFGDTSFTESFNLSNFYFPRVYSKSDCIIILYSIVDKNSFERCNFYRDKILEFCKDKNVLLLGNKSDRNDRSVSFEEAEKFAKDINIKYFETSAEKNIGISDMMNYIVNKCISIIKSRNEEGFRETVQESSLDLSNFNNNKKNKFWC